MIFRAYDDILLPSGELVKFRWYVPINEWDNSRRRARVRFQDGHHETVDISEATLAPCVTEMALDAVAVAFGKLEGAE